MNEQEKDMTLEEAIQHCEEIIPHMKPKCAQDHIQLRNWLIELKNYRKKYIDN